MKSLLIAALSLFSLQAAAIEAPSTSGTLVEEVMAQSRGPHKYDWRDDTATVSLGYSSVQEYNGFQSHSYDLGVLAPMGGPWIFRGAVRKVQTQDTSASRLLALTPFSQAAQPSRWEFMVGGGFALLDGRSATALSPRLTDIGHALYAIVGAQYNLFGNKNPEPIQGMRAVYYDYTADAGLRLQIYFPHNLGVGVEWTYNVPIKGADVDLSSWQRFSGNLTWSFGP